MTSIQIKPESSICTALLQLTNGHIEACRCTLGDALDRLVEAGEDPREGLPFIMMRAANYLDNGQSFEAKTVLAAAIAPLPKGTGRT